MPVATEPVAAAAIYLPWGWRLEPRILHPSHLWRILVLRYVADKRYAYADVANDCRISGS